MKEKILLGISAAAIIIAGTAWIRSTKAQIAYADYSCPVCGSDEVLDYGETAHGRHAQCFDCKTEFYTSDEYDYE